MTDDKKTPSPPITPSQTLYKPIQFWGAIVNSLDKQFEFMEKNNCYGKISVEFKFWGGKMTDKTSIIVVNDKVVEKKTENVS